MTGKLIKYEFRSITKMMAIVWVALPIMALITGISGKIGFTDAAHENKFFFADMMEIVSSFLFGGIFMAMLAVTVLMILLRFYKGLLRDEGYLMHTLPVRTWQLITAKGVVAVCVTLISILVAFLSILFLTAFDGGIGEFFELMAELIRSYGEKPVFILITMELIVLMVAWITAGIYRFYASMAIGQLAKQHKVLLSVAAYLGIGVAGMILMAVIGRILDLGIFESMLDVVFGWMKAFSALEAVQAGLITLTVIAVIETAVFHIISEQILRKRLNLE